MRNFAWFRSRQQLHWEAAAACLAQLFFSARGAAHFRHGTNGIVVGLCILFSPFPIYAQRYEVGVQLTGVHLHKIDEGAFGIGARFHYNLTPLIASDLEVTHYPENSSGNFGETTVLFGVRAGKRFDRFGAFLKGRPGFIHFGGEYFASRMEPKTHLMFDLGGILEYYPSPHTFVRIEGGDTVIYFGGTRLNNRPNPDPLGTIHNFQSGAGFGFRF